jgi:hypothetical protein
VGPIRGIPLAGGSGLRPEYNRKSCRGACGRRKFTKGGNKGWGYHHNDLDHGDDWGGGPDFPGANRNRSLRSADAIDFFEFGGGSLRMAGWPPLLLFRCWACQAGARACWMEAGCHRNCHFRRVCLFPHGGFIYSPSIIAMSISGWPRRRPAFGPARPACGRSGMALMDWLAASPVVLGCCRTRR